MLLTAVNIVIGQTAADVLAGKGDLDGVDHTVRNDINFNIIESDEIRFFFLSVLILEKFSN